MRSHMKAWMFESQIAKSLFTVLADVKKFDDVLVYADLANAVDEFDLSVIRDYLSRIQTPFITETKDGAIQKLVDHIKLQYLARELHRYNEDGYDPKVWDRLAEAAAVSPLNGNVFDFNNVDDVRRAKMEMYPTGSVKVVKSSFSLINDCQQSGGYTPGTVNMFVARPGLGKTTIMLNEALAAILQGCKVFHMFLGDMSAFDAISKYAACFHSTSIRGIIKDFDQVLMGEDDRFRTMVTPNLRTAFYAAEQLDASQLSGIAQSLHRDWPFDVLIVDYDSNLRPMKSDNMYESGGATYAKLDRLAKHLHVIMHVGCQSKIQYWGEEIVPLEGAVESSRKQHTVDAMFTLGKEHKAGKVGTLNIAKMRRGESDRQMRVHFEGDKAKINEVGEEEYQRLLARSKDENPVKA